VAGEGLGWRTTRGKGGGRGKWRGEKGKGKLPPSYSRTRAPQSLATPLVRVSVNHFYMNDMLQTRPPRFDVLHK